MPFSSDTLGPRDPKFGTRVHVNKGYLNMHNLGVQKLGGGGGGQNDGFFLFLGNFLDFSFLLHNSPKNVKNDIF